MVYGNIKLAFVHPLTFRLMLALLGIGLGHSLARLAYPHFFPSRYIALTIPLLIVTLFASSLYCLLNSITLFKKKRWFISPIVISIVAAIILLFGA